MLAANETKKIPLTIDLRGKSAAPGETRPFSVVISALTIDGHEMRWGVTGMVRDAFWMAVPETISLSTIAGNETPATRRIAFKNDPAAKDIRVESDLLYFNAHLIDENASGAFLVEISALPTKTPGSIVGHFILSGTHTDGNQISSEWPVKISWISDLAGEPQITHLGAIQAGIALKANYSVTSRTGRQLNGLEFVVHQKHNVEVECHNDADGFSVVVTPESKGHCSFDLAISEPQNPKVQTVTAQTIIEFVAEAFEGRQNPDLN